MRKFDDSEYTKYKRILKLVKLMKSSMFKVQFTPSTLHEKCITYIKGILSQTFVIFKGHVEENEYKLHKDIKRMVVRSMK